MTQQHNPDIGDCLSEGWTLYKRDAALLSGATLLMAVICGVVSLIPLLGSLIYPPLLAGLYSMIIRLDRGETVTITNLFDGFQRLLPLIIASFLISLFVAIGLILFVIPGLYLLTIYGFTTLFIVDQNQDFWPAMESSRKIIHGHFWHYSLLALLLGIICVIASLPLGLGLLIAAPVCLAAQYHYYRAVTSTATTY
ncbi:conserved hypothetical protein [gamma proteobacterium NOR5-3]|nr:conserved hypothetical protein [gamma proteobacterium NOR5-3]